MENLFAREISSELAENNNQKRRRTLAWFDAPLR
jgi:hypothetical protein